MSVPRVSPAPAPTALELLHAELDWVEKRVIRIAREQQQNSQGRRRPFHEEHAPVGPPLPTLRRQEGNARTTFEALCARCADPVGLDAVVASFGLQPIERTALLLASGVALHRRIGRLLGELEDGCGGTCTVEDVFTFEELPLVARVDARRHFRPTAPLFASDLCELGMGRRYSHPEQLLDANVSITGRGLELVLGNSALAEEMELFSTLETPRASFDAVVLPPADRARILSVVDHADRAREVYDAWGVDEVVRGASGLLLLFTGAPGTGKTTTAHAVAARLGRRVLNVDIPTFVEHADAARFLPGLFREARLHDALLFFDECEALFETRRNGNALMTLLLTELDRFDGIAVLATNLPDRLDPALDRRVRVRVDFGAPDAIARAALWRMHLPPRAALAVDVDVDALARRYDLVGGYIRNAVLNAVSAAVCDAPGAPVLRHAHLDAAARDQSRRPAAEDAMTGIQEPRATLADVCLLAPALREVRGIVGAAGARRTVFDRWGVAARQSGGRGVVALFHGPPGTGKTLCAEAIAGELGRGLLRVTLPSVLSRWVGEAERNLARAFATAASGDAVLLLDEIDGLLMARGEGRASRHDDGLVNALLDLLDRHDGVVVLCTNRPEVLDRALDRRVGWRVAFDAPDAAARAAIWRQVVPPSATGGRALDMRGLAARYALTGGRIRTAAIRAAARAATEGRELDLAALAEAAAEEAGEVPPNLAAGAVGGPVGDA
jgi:SpoVK/Ycf46/Vps4 family AAA+-type ATPase